MIKKSFALFLSHVRASDFLIYTLIYGIVIRLFFVLSSDFPLNDGGLFYTMVRDLTQSGFRLPVYTTYNHLDIPFAYPPLAFYLVAAATKFLPLTIIEIFRFLPLSASILTIPVFYLVARKLLPIRSALLATFVFTALPHSFLWNIMGGGITRSPGFLFSLISIFWGIKLFNEPKNKYFLSLSVFLTLTILTHLQWAVFAISSLAIIVLKFKNKLKRILGLLAATASSLLLSSLWWLLIVNRHGLEPFVSFSNASRSGFNLITIIFHPLLLTTLRFTDEPFLTPYAVMGILGIVLCLFSHRFWLAVWFVVPMLVSPRSSPILIVVPLALIVGGLLSEMIIPKAKKGGGGAASVNWPNKVVFFLLAVYSVFSSIGLLYPNNIYFKSVSPSQREAMNWTRANTKKSDKFLLITQTPDRYWGMDNTSEWFPALSERASIATPQGTEWLGDQKFYKQTKFYIKLNSCYDEGLECLEGVAQEGGVDFDFVYLEKGLDSEAFDRTSLLKYNLLQSPKHSVVYENEEAIIFARKP